MFKSNVCRLTVVLLLLLYAVTASAESIGGLFDTGVDGSGNLLGNLVIDSHYQLVTAPAVVTTLPNSYAYSDAYVNSTVRAAYPGSWATSTATSQWIGPNDDILAQGDPGWASPPPFTYNLSFSLTGLNPNTVLIEGTWATDNSATILVNGVATGITKGDTGYASLDSFSLNASLLPGIFHTGLNTISFVVSNEYENLSFNPTGLLVDDLHGSAAVAPEPTTLLSLGFIFLAATGWFGARRLLLPALSIT